MFVHFGIGSLDLPLKPLVSGISLAKGLHHVGSNLGRAVHAALLLSAATAPPANPSSTLADLPPMTVGYAEESVTIDGSPDGYWKPDEVKTINH